MARNELLTRIPEGPIYGDAWVVRLQTSAWHQLRRRPINPPGRLKSWRDTYSNRMHEVVVRAACHSDVNRCGLHQFNSARSQMEKLVGFHFHGLRPAEQQSFQQVFVFILLAYISQSTCLVRPPLQVA